MVTFACFLKLCLFVEMQTVLYKEDWIGLKALDEGGRVTYIAFPGDHLSINDLEVKDFVVPYLTGSSPMSSAYRVI